MLYGGELLSIEAMLKVMLLIIFKLPTSSFMMYYIVSWFKSINAFSTASSIVGTLIGFLTGYLHSNWKCTRSHSNGH